MTSKIGTKKAGRQVKLSESAAFESDMTSVKAAPQETSQDIILFREHQTEHWNLVLRISSTLDSLVQLVGSVGMLQHNLTYSRAADLLENEPNVPVHGDESYGETQTRSTLVSLLRRNQEIKNILPSTGHWLPARFYNITVPSNAAHWYELVGFLTERMSTGSPCADSSEPYIITRHYDLHSQLTSWESDTSIPECLMTACISENVGAVRDSIGDLTSQVYSLHRRLLGEASTIFDNDAVGVAPTILSGSDFDSIGLLTSPLADFADGLDDLRKAYAQFAETVQSVTYTPRPVAIDCYKEDADEPAQIQVPYKGRPNKRLTKQ